MFCPQCGSSHSDEIKFCKLCGANLQGVQQVMTSRPPDGKFNWNKTWVAEMFLSEGERKKRCADLDAERGITPEVKRYKEVKAGVITGSLGVALMIFLNFFMEGLIRSGKIPDDATEILSRVWIAGVIPLFVGMALIFNGLFVSKKIAEVMRKQQPMSPEMPAGTPKPRTLRPVDTTEFVPASFSVTEDTTRHLGKPPQKQPR